MAHHHGHEPAIVERSTVISDRDSGANVIVAVLAVILVLFLIWAIFFSGWVIDRDTSPAPTQMERNEENTEIDVNQPGTGTYPGTGTGGGETTAPSP